MQAFGLAQTALAANELLCANKATLAIDASRHDVLHVVMEKVNESVNRQAVGAYNCVGALEPWEFAALPSTRVDLFVGSDPVSQKGHHQPLTLLLGVGGNWTTIAKSAGFTVTAGVS